jgi:cytochrome c oxidase cbb3-type subunit 3
VRQPCHAVLLAFVALITACGGRKPAQASAQSAQVEQGRQTYGRLCATCHGPEGNGYKSDNAPSLRTTTFLASVSDNFLTEAIGRGRPGTAMPAYGRWLGGPLQTSDIDALLAFLRAGGPPKVEPPAPGPGDVAQGKTLYQTACVRCHGTATQRSTAVHLANPVLLQTASDAFLRYAVAEGRPPTSMVTWKNTLTPKQIDDVVAYVRSMAVPPGTPAVPPALPPAAPRTGPIVINRRGRDPDFTLKAELYVSIDQVKAALDAKRRLIIADARPPSDYLNLHITGAISTPYYDVKSLDDLPKDGTWIVAYCACPHHLSGSVVDELRRRGYPHTAVLDEGIFAWQQKKYPVVAAPGMHPPPAPPSFPAPPPPHH